jgi:hypothetical protein
MSYLKSAFAEVNAKLNRIIDLQVKTLNAVADLAKAQDAFRTEVLGQLDRIETVVLQNQQLLQGLVLAQWDDCHAVIYGPASLNGTFSIRDQEQLVGIIGDSGLPQSAAGCYRVLTRFLDANVKSAAWAGTLIAANLFPTDQLPGNPQLQRALQSYQAQKGNAFETARAFFARATSASDAAHPGLADTPASLAARLAQPMSDVAGVRALATIIGTPDAQKSLADFRCTDNGVVSPAIRDLLCVGTAPTIPSPPNAGQLQALLNAPLIGPQAYWLMDMGLVLSAISDFAVRGRDGSFGFVDPLDVTAFSTEGPSQTIITAVRQHKGIDLLARLRWLSESLVLQQAIAYGDLTTELAERALYDPQTHSLDVDPSKCKTDCQRKQLALLAMKANPTLARNVVRLAMRHVIEDSLGGADRADAVLYKQTYYQLSLADFSGPQACEADITARAKLQELFPNWNFEYRATSVQQQTGYADCQRETVGDLSNPSALPPAGSGVAVNLGDFYVTVPNPTALSQGVFEQGDGLKLAIAYRDRISQALIDRDMGTVLRDVVAEAGGDPEMVRQTAYGLINSAWDWQPTRQQVQ